MKTRVRSSLPLTVARASRNLRLGCVLQSMLLLAHNLGLSTMGPSTPEGDGSISATPRFDYVPSASVSFIAAPPPAPRLAFADGLVLPARISR